MRSCRGFGHIRVEVPIPRVPPSLYSRGRVSDPLGVGYRLETESYPFLKGARARTLCYFRELRGLATFLASPGPQYALLDYPIDSRVNWA